MKKTVAMFIWLLFAIACQARIITVDDDGPADFNNLQAAIDDANHGDVIEVQPGTYTGDGNSDIDFLGKAITVRSIDPNDPNIVAATIIDCNEEGIGNTAEYVSLRSSGRLSVEQIPIPVPKAKRRHVASRQRCWYFHLLIKANLGRPLSESSTSPAIGCTLPSDEVK